MANHFGQEYFARQYRGRAWRKPGSKPVLDNTRVRWLTRRISGGVLLEVGSGYGAFARAASSQFSVVGLDLETDVVRTAFEGTGVHPVVGSGTALPLRSETFDVVVALDVLEHISTPEVALEEFRRVLRPGGHLFLSMPNPEGWGARRKGDQSFIYRDPTHCSVLPMAEWQNLLRSGGFDVVWKGTDSLWDPPYIDVVPAKLQWAVFVGIAQLAWRVAPAFPWTRGENFVSLSRRCD